MRHIKRLSKTMTLLTAVSVSAWGLGCAQQAEKSGKSNGAANKSKAAANGSANANGSEAGSTTSPGGGTAAPGTDDKADE